jgi:hypothetical protein
MVFRKQCYLERDQETSACLRQRRYRHASSMSMCYAGGAGREAAADGEEVDAIVPRADST